MCVYNHILFSSTSSDKKKLTKLQALLVNVEFLFIFIFYLKEG